MVECTAGATAETTFPNKVTMATFGHNPKPTSVDYRLMRAAVLTGMRGRLGARSCACSIYYLTQPRSQIFSQSHSISLFFLAHPTDHAASDSGRAFAEWRVGDVGDDGNLRCGQSRPSCRRARHGRLHGSLQPTALALAKLSSRAIARLASSSRNHTAGYSSKSTKKAHWRLTYFCKRN